jgi:hypothetical protein
MRKIELNRLNGNCSIEFSTRQFKIFTHNGRADERIFQALLIVDKTNEECYFIEDMVACPHIATLILIGYLIH